MDGDAVEVVHPERADVAGRVRCPGRMGPGGVGVEHRVIDDQLAASFEEVAECLAPVLTLERVWLLDELPGQLAPLPAELVAHPGELLLLRQVSLPRLEPLIVVHRLVGCHVILPPHAHSSPETATLRGISSVSNTSPVRGSTRRTSLSSPSQVPCQSILVTRQWSRE